MREKRLFFTGAFLFGFVWLAGADGLQRLGHTTLTPRHSSPDDKGMYAALVDTNGGHAYFFGNYLFKLDITGNLPVQVGPALLTGQYTEGAIDPAAGYAYMPKSGTIYRYALGAGTNAVAAAGSLVLPEGASPSMSIVVDNSDPNPANHYAYVLCSGTPAKVVKIALGSFTEVSSVTLNAGENAFAWGQIDVQKGYAYFASWAVYNAPVMPQVVKIKLTPGTNAPIRLGTVNLGATPVPLWTSSIDTLHGYAYYGTDNGTTNIPETVFKVKLGDGDTLPSAVPFGGVSLHTNEIQLISQVIDPVRGYLYFGTDNTYPARIYQFSLNGTNAPVEQPYLQLQGGTNSTTPINGVTAGNIASDGTNLPYGEVFLRSAVFDPASGYAYFGQDSRPNQVVKVKVAQNLPANISSGTKLTGGAFQLAFTNAPYASFTALTSTNPAVPFTNWTVLGSVTEVTPGQYQFTDTPPTNAPGRFYSIRSP
jgi:hypothetical protein